MNLLVESLESRSRRKHVDLMFFRILIITYIKVNLVHLNERIQGKDDLNLL